MLCKTVLQHQCTLAYFQCLPFQKSSFKQTQRLLRPVHNNLKCLVRAAFRPVLKVIRYMVRFLRMECIIPVMHHQPRNFEISLALHKFFVMQKFHFVLLFYPPSRMRFGRMKRLHILQLQIPYCISLIMVITCLIFRSILQTVHFSAGKFTRGNEKNRSFLLTPKSQVLK